MDSPFIRYSWRFILMVHSSKTGLDFGRNIENTDRIESKTNIDSFDTKLPSHFMATIALSQTKTESSPKSRAKQEQFHGVSAWWAKTSHLIMFEKRVIEMNWNVKSDIMERQSEHWCWSPNLDRMQGSLGSRPTTFNKSLITWGTFRSNLVLQIKRGNLIIKRSKSCNTPLKWQGERSPKRDKTISGMCGETARGGRREYIDYNATSNSHFDGYLER